jgi:hypothetical protein
MKALITGVLIFIFGYILISLGSGLFGSVDTDNTDLIIILAVLFLSAIVGASTMAILEEIRKIDK